MLQDRSRLACRKLMSLASSSLPFVNYAPHPEGYQEIASFMRITSTLFDAYLKCPIKCWLKSVGDHATDNPYAQWVHSQHESYRATGIQRLLSKTAQGE